MEYITGYVYKWIDGQDGIVILTRFYIKGQCNLIGKQSYFDCRYLLLYLIYKKLKQMFENDTKKKIFKLLASSSL